MHHLRDRTSVIRLRIASWLLLVTSFTGGTIAGLLVYAMIDEAPLAAYVALVLGGFLIVFTLAQVTCASQVRCPICLVTPLAPHLCSKNRRAAKLLGSYRLRVAASVLHEGTFQCPYCGEMTRVETRAEVPHILRHSGSHALSRGLPTPTNCLRGRGADSRFRGFAKCPPTQTVDRFEP